MTDGHQPSGVRREVATVLGALAVAAVFSGHPTDAGGATRACAPATKDGVRVIRLQRALGCTTGLRLAVRVVNNDGYYQDSRYFCRWGQGGTRPIRVGGTTYIPGFCYRKSDEREAGFLARTR